MLIYNLPIDKIVNVNFVEPKLKKKDKFSSGNSSSKNSCRQHMTLPIVITNNYATLAQVICNIDSIIRRIPIEELDFDLSFFLLQRNIPEFFPTKSRTHLLYGRLSSKNFMS